MCPVWDEWDFLVRTERRVRGLAIPRNAGLPLFEGGIELVRDNLIGQIKKGLSKPTNLLSVGFPLFAH
jgi:hypothetical protein